MSPPRRRASARSGSSSNSSSRRKAAPRRDFWDGVDSGEEEVVLIRRLDDPSAMVRSLGPPPLPGREIVAEQSFALAYDKAARRAVALAAAFGLMDLSELEED
jgi:hypothetical protein